MVLVRLDGVMGLALVLAGVTWKNKINTLPSMGGVFIFVGIGG